MTSDTRPTPGRFLIAFFAATIALTIVSSPVSAQCAMCRTLLNTPEGQQLVAGFRSGILLLLVAPFLAFGTVAVLAVRAQRRPSPTDDDTSNRS